MPSPAQTSRTRRSGRGVGWQHDRVGRGLEAAAAHPRQVGVAAAARVAQPVLGRGEDVLGADRLDQRRGQRLRRRAARTPRGSRASGQGSSSPIRSRSTASASASSSGAIAGSPHPHQFESRAARHRPHGDFRGTRAKRASPHVSALSIPSSASSRIAPWPRRIIGEPIRDIPLSVCAEAMLTSVSPSRRPQPDLDPRAAQVAGERRALQLLLPDVALLLGRAEAAEVGPHAPALGRLQHLGPLAAPAGGLAARRSRPARSAATSAAGCRDRRRASRPRDRRRDRPLAGHPGHRSRGAVSRRRGGAGRGPAAGA